MWDLRRLIVVVVAAPLLWTSGCIFSGTTGGGATQDTASGDTGAVDARDGADGGADTVDGDADMSEADPADADTGLDCENDDKREGCPCEMPVEEPDAEVCRKAVYGPEGECQPPDKYVESEGENKKGCSDTIDNDCDGDVNEFCPCQINHNKGVGVCETAVRDKTGECDKPDDLVEVEDTENNHDLCDDRDNDCDGETDENCDCVAESSCYTGASETHENGTCQKGTTVCDGGQFADCDGEVTPNESDRCEGDDRGADDDCDGVVDEGCSCEFIPEDQEADGPKGVCRDAAIGDDDGECRPPSELYEEGSESSCDDGKDNDCDGYKDCADPDCEGESCGGGSERCCNDEAGDGACCEANFSCAASVCLGG